MKRVVAYFIYVLIFLTRGGIVTGQAIGSSVPIKIDAYGKYLFYLRRATVTDLGDNGSNQSFPE
jgi:hypothetical protein